MTIRINLIVAACENMGIGMQGSLPWRLKNEMKHFAKMTKFTEDTAKMNAVVMGRKTWESIPDKFRPLSGRLNVVLSRNPEYSIGTHEDVLVFRSLQDSLKALQDCKLEVATIWIIGGSSVYAEALPLCHRIYLTEIQSNFECDTFLPEIPKGDFEHVIDLNVPEGVQVEGDIKYTYKVLQRKYES